MKPLTLAQPTPMDTTTCGWCEKPTPKTVPLGPVYCSAPCWYSATIRQAHRLAVLGEPNQGPADRESDGSQVPGLEKNARKILSEKK